MLDENLPAFFLRPSSTGLKHHRDLFLTHHGSDPAPAYTVRHADPASPSLAHKNCYAAALFDAYNPEVLFGEVLARPGWTQPSLSAEELRRNGGVQPPPQPILPGEFVVQLYNPDQQIRVELKEGKWGASDSYEFSMPISTFRTPSASNLDRGQSDPAGLATTPKLFFAWRKESKLSKDLTCYMTGRSTDTTKKRNNRKDPDIAVALWRSMRELTIYEPNISRLDMEDPKGLEVAFLLSAIVIKDLYFSSKDHLRKVFNVSDDPTGRKLSAGGRKLSNPQNTNSINGAPAPTASNPLPLARTAPQSANDVKRQSLPKLQTTPPKTPHPDYQAAPPSADPRAQWELDAETARLKAQAESEAKEQRRRRRERAKADEAEAKRLQRMADEETKIARRKQADIEKETERLRKQYGVQPIPQRRGPPQANSSSSRQHRQQPPRLQPIPQRSQMNLQLPPQNTSMSQRPSASTSNLAMSGGNPGASASHISLTAPSQQKPKQKKSFFGLRNVSEEGQQGGSSSGRLKKKQSSFW
ncbi:hypothetical protein KC345_g7485 [Hortaea werneckii]|nr:hypothetical protein KC345_g7485 [Hortaea werneckii]